MSTGIRSGEFPSQMPLPFLLTLLRFQHFFNQLLLIAQTQTNVKVHLKVHREFLSLVKTLRALDSRWRHPVTGPGQVDFVPVNGASLFRNRVDIPALVNEVCDEVLENVASKGAERGGGVKIGICGPTILVKNLRRAVADVPRDRTVKVYVFIPYHLHTSPEANVIYQRQGRDSRPQRDVRLIDFLGFFAKQTLSAFSAAARLMRASAYRCIVCIIDVLLFYLSAMFNVRCLWSPTC